ncbi:MAG TPA: hypothetical protein VFM34_00135 [Moraxellaceae bacterium]|nr:hypothetical protein [Moraxellaceae bacterium]
MTKHPKIDLYRVHRNQRGRITRTEYICSTNWASTCREAVARFHEINAADAITGKNLVPLGVELKGQFA